MSVAAAYLAYRPSPYPSSPRRLPGNDFLGSRTTSSGRRAMQPRISTSTKPRRPLDPMQWTDVDLADYVQHHYELPQATSLVAFLEQFRIHPLALWDLQSCHDDLSSLTNGNNALNQLVLRLANQIRPVVSPSTPKPKRAWELSKELDIPSPPPPPPSPLPEEPELDEENNDAESTVSEWALDELTEQEEMQADVGEQPVYVASEQDYSEPAFGGLGLDTGVPSETGYQDPEPQQAEEDLIHFDEETQPEHPTHAAEGGTRDENVEGDAPSAEPPHTDDTAEPAGPLPASTDAGEDDTPVHEEEASQTPTGAETESDLGESGAHVHVHVDESTGDTLPQADEPIAQDDDETQQQGDVHKHDTETPAVAEEHAETSTTGGTSAEEDVQAKTTGSEAAAEDSEEVHVQQETDRSGPEASVSQQDSSTGPNAASVEEQRNLDDSQTTAPVEDEHVSVTPPPDVHASSVQEGTAPAEAEPPSNATPGDSTDSGDQEGATTPQEEAAPTASSPVPETPTDAAGGAADEASPQTTPPADTIPEDEQPTPEEEQVEEEQPDTTEDEQTTTAGEEPSQSNMKTTDTPEPEAAGSSSDPADGTAEQQQQPDEDSSNTADADTAEAMSLGKTPTKEEEPSSTQDAREDLCSNSGIDTD
ncbi:hypothetical protein C8Q70DRAFT_670093 [Cubamyces menziesii]|nr:hypothetical protein C8Q70DRAFT_670093 [Cubamyces menziesii]